MVGVVAVVDDDETAGLLVGVVGGRRLAVLGVVGAAGPDVVSVLAGAAGPDVVSVLAGACAAVVGLTASSTGGAVSTPREPAMATAGCRSPDACSVGSAAAAAATINAAAMA